jgi:hypothetical protein
VRAAIRPTSSKKPCGCCDEPKAGEQEDRKRKRKPEELKPIDRDERAQHYVASLKDAENPEIDTGCLRLIIRWPFNEPPAAIEKLEVIGDHRVARIERISLLKLSARRSQIAAQHV